MLKRQRSIPSFPPDSCAVPDMAIDMFEERVIKRRRQLAPPYPQNAGKGKMPWSAGDSDGEEDIESSEEAGRSMPSEQAQRLERAGEYKNVNTLLHDLHAEQRHRMLFSSSIPLSQLPIAYLPRPETALPPAQSTSSTSNYDMRSVTFQQHHRQMPSFTLTIPTKDASVVDHVEVQRVTERYEDTNRLLGSLFLSRRRQPNDPET